MGSQRLGPDLETEHAGMEWKPISKKYLKSSVVRNTA